MKEPPSRSGSVLHGLLQQPNQKTNLIKTKRAYQWTGKHKLWLMCAVLGLAAAVIFTLFPKLRHPHLRRRVGGLASAVYSNLFQHRTQAQSNEAWEPEKLVPAVPGIVEGCLRVSAFGARIPEIHTGHEPLRHMTVYVNGPDYSGMEDNDMRGFLDGRYKYDWNQAGQIHVRPGRRDDAPAFGEHELFRVPYRWDRIELPADASLCRAALQISVEHGPAVGLWLVLYELKKDYSPGHGGKKHDNVSPAASTEVWWDERSAGLEAWALPGAGFASDYDPDADTSAGPLAAAQWVPSDRSIEFASSNLTAYAAARIASGKPLLFLLKIADYQEDIPGDRIGLYSANEGANRCVARRPRLVLEWESRSEIAVNEQQVLLEYGRTLALPRVQARGAKFIAATFYPRPGMESPEIEVRGGTDTNTSPWQNATLPVRVDWDWYEIRLRAVHDPVVLGQAFQDDVRDTWVVSGPREKQLVPWNFISPSGQRFQSNAQYVDFSHWLIRFEPTEIGRWKYYWSDAFNEHVPYESAVGVFDVVAGDQESIRIQLKKLASQIRASGLKNPNDRIGRFSTTFDRLERAALRTQTPNTYASESGTKLRELLDDVRAALTGMNTKNFDSSANPNGHPAGTNGARILGR